MRLFAPAAILVAALVALARAPAAEPLLGLSHADFARGACALSVLTWITLGALSWAGAAGAARVLSAAAFWALALVGLAVGYDRRGDVAEIADRVMGEFGPPAAHVGPGGEVVVRRRFDGEFLVPGQVNGAAVAFVFDTGATSVVLTAEDARAAGLRAAALDYSVEVATANGSALAAPVKLDRVAVGSITARGVRALIARPGALSRSLLGMSFLDRLKSFAVEKGQLVLRSE